LVLQLIKKKKIEKNIPKRENSYSLDKKQSVQSFIDHIKEFCLNSKNIERHLGCLKQRGGGEETGLTSSGLHLERLFYLQCKKQMEIIK
jgi:hypothetical protein